MARGGTTSRPSAKRDSTKTPPPRPRSRKGCARRTGQARDHAYRRTTDRSDGPWSIRVTMEALCLRLPVGAGKSQVFQGGLPAMLLGDDVIEGEGELGDMSRDAAVLAP